MLKVVYSNDMTRLAQQLSAAMHQSPLPPMQAEMVVVQSNALSRWLSLFLATQHGVISQVDFPYPSAFLWQLSRQLLPNVPSQSAFATDVLTWRLFGLLAACEDSIDFTPITHYLAGDSDPIKRFELARRIADSFDQYLVYRPDWIAEWEDKSQPLPHWQARLWRQVMDDSGGHQHRAAVLSALTARLYKEGFDGTKLPQRIHLFGISALPPAQLEVFAALSKHCDVTLYMPMPCEGYWAELVAEKSLAKQPEELMYAEVGHPLVSSLGRQGQALLSQIQEFEAVDIEDYQPPVGTSLLARCQHDMYALADGAAAKKHAIDTTDKSIQLHICHSQTRELEVLHDQLLALFSATPDLAASDIVVMTPNIEAYAPTIDAVFGSRQRQRGALSYQIADCGVTTQNPILATWSTLLALPQSRFEVSAVMALLDCTAIRERFGISESDLEKVAEWLAETHVHWGFSAADKITENTDDQHTWRQGLDRLLLSYAMRPDKHGSLFDARLAISGVQSAGAALVASLATFIQRLQQWRQRLQAIHTAAAWQTELLSMLADFFDNTADPASIGLIRTSLNKLSETATLADFEEEIPISIAAAWLDNHLETAEKPMRFMGQGITFCGMVPMRRVPFQVVCLLGMNNGAYPRRDAKLGFDLLARHYRLGDRARREDDRYLFLEAILSAQQTLYISYLGAQVTDNAVLPPSVLVSDLRDVLDRGYIGESGKLSDQITTQHRLQSFSPRYYSNGSAALFSYDKTACPPTECTPKPPWFDAAMDAWPTEHKAVTLSQLQAYFAAPTRTLLAQRLNTQWWDNSTVLSDCEPFSIDAREGWRLRQQWLRQALAGQDMVRQAEWAQATGSVPAGIGGSVKMQTAMDRVSPFVAPLKANEKTAVEGQSVSVDLGEFSVRGFLQNLHEEGAWFYRLGKQKTSDMLRVWLAHLLRNATTGHAAPRITYWLIEGDKVPLERVTFAAIARAEAVALLTDLVALYWRGMQSPLPLFPDSSYAYAAHLAKKPDELSKATVAAYKKWESAYHSDIPGEGDDLAVQQCFDEAPFGDEFADIATQVYAPMIAAMTKESYADL